VGHRPAVWSRAPYSSKRLEWQPFTSLVANLDTLSSQKVPVCKTLAQSNTGFTGFRATAGAPEPVPSRRQRVATRARASGRQLLAHGRDPEPWEKQSANSPSPRQRGSP